jgi:hypothetical protein
LRALLSASAAVALSFGVLAMTAPTASQAQIGISLGITVGFAPPALPVYVQPPIPDYGYVWTPGYWSWDAEIQDYFWVPGTWVRPPRVGVLWTPGYWGWRDGVYAFNAGYWGEHVGFYGGVNYGFGYGGFGYGGGEWRGGQFFYNRSVNNITNVRITNVYERTVAVSGSRASFNGGAGGVQARPTAEEASYAHEAHVAPTPEQEKHVQTARAEPSLRASVNHGAPAVAATGRPGDLHGPGVVRAAPASATYRAPVAKAGAERGAAPGERPARAPRVSPDERPVGAPRAESPKPENVRREAVRPDPGHPAGGRPPAARPPKPEREKPAPKPEERKERKE